MKKRILALFLSLVLCLSLLPIGVAAAKVSETGATFHIKKGTPEIDGVIDPVYIANDTKTCMVINKESAPLVTGSDLHTDVTANVYMLYDADWIYFAAEVKDPTPINTANNGKIPGNYMTDGIELAFYDGSAIRRVCVSPWNEITNYGDDNHKGFFNSDGTQCRTAFNNSCQAAFKKEEDKPGNYVIELAIPNRQYSLSKFFYFSIQLNDVFKKENGELILVAYGSQSMNSSMKFTAASEVGCNNDADSMYYGVKYGQAMGTELKVAKATPSLEDGGRLDEAYMDSTMLHIDANTNNKLGMSGTDTSMDVRLLYDDTYIYAAIRVFDETFVDSANDNGWIPGPVVKEENGVEQCYGYYTDGIEIFLASDTNQRRRISVAPNDKITCAGKPGFFNSYNHESSSELNERCELAYSFSVDKEYLHEFPENGTDYDGIYYIELKFPHDGLIYQAAPRVSFQVNDVYDDDVWSKKDDAFVAYGSQQREFILNFVGSAHYPEHESKYIFDDSDAIDPGEYVVAFNGKPKIDGKLDKIYQHADFFITDHEYMITTSGGGVGKSDVIAKTYVMHDKDYIYFATEVTESSLTDTKERDKEGNLVIPGSWMIDGVELWIKTHGGQRSRISVSPFYDDFYGDPQRLDQYAYFDYCKRGTSIIDKNGDGNPDGYIVEIAIPMEDRFTNGLNFSLQINDFIGNTNRYASYGIHGQKSGLLNWVIFSTDTSAHKWGQWSDAGNEGNAKKETRSCAGCNETEERTVEQQINVGGIMLNTYKVDNKPIVEANENLVKTDTEDKTQTIDLTALETEETVDNLLLTPEVIDKIQNNATEQGKNEVVVKTDDVSITLPTDLFIPDTPTSDDGSSDGESGEGGAEGTAPTYKETTIKMDKLDSITDAGSQMSAGQKAQLEQYNSRFVTAIDISMSVEGVEIKELGKDKEGNPKKVKIFIPYDYPEGAKDGDYMIVYIHTDGTEERINVTLVKRGDKHGFEFETTHL